MKAPTTKTPAQAEQGLFVNTNILKPIKNGMSIW
jgi:hypothetical protein